MAARDLGLVLKAPFEEQVAFFRGKLGNLVPTQAWDDLWKAQHDRAFMVAGAMKADLLADLAGAVDKSIAEGKSIQWFRQEFDRIVARHGWAYRGEHDWRTRVIYQTNMSTSYAAGRLAQLRAGGFPYWMYKHSDSVAHPRPLHVSWDGLTLPAGDPWWQTHYPPNGWGCKCRVVGIRDAAAARRLGGRMAPAGPDDGVVHGTDRPAGIDKGWDYMPGATSDLARGIQPSLLDDPPKGRPVIRRPICPDDGEAALAARLCPGPVPRPRPFDPARLLPDGKPPAWYVQAFLEPFGAAIGKSSVFSDVNGEPLLISDDLFIDRARTLPAGRPVYKSMKHGRHRYLMMLAETLMHPQEKWDAWEWIGARGEMARRVRYLAWWTLEEEGKTGLSVFELVPKRWWTGVTTFVPEFESDAQLAEYLDAQRHGVRRWPK